MGNVSRRGPKRDRTRESIVIETPTTEDERSLSRTDDDASSTKFSDDKLMNVVDEDKERSPEMDNTDVPTEGR